MKWLFLLCLALPVIGYSQLVKVREIRRRTVVYPVFVTGNRKVDSVINKQVRSILEADERGMSLLKAIQATIRDGLTDLAYEITFSNRNFLSVKFSLEWSGGAYPNTAETYLSFDLRTGAELTMNDLFGRNQLERIKPIVFAAKVKFLRAYKAEWVDSLHTGQDSDYYQMAMDQVDNYCIDSIELDNFSLSKSGVEFIDPCDFPHVIRAFEPDYSLKYTYSELAAYLKPEFRKRVLGP